MIADLRGYFINLDRAEERRKNVEAQLDRYGLTEIFSRFPAVDGRLLPKSPPSSKLTPGEVAIFKSHIDVLKEASKFSTYAYVLEDDAILSDFVVPFLTFALKLQLLSVFDLFFFGITPLPNLEGMRLLKSASAKAFSKPISEVGAPDFNIVEVGQLGFLGTDSYVVSPGSFGKLLDLYETEWANGPGVPADHFLRREIRAGRIRAGCVVPFVTNVGLDSRSTQSGRKDPENAMVLNSLIRDSFFIGRNMAELSADVDRFISRTRSDRHRDEHYDLLHKLLGYELIDRPDDEALKMESSVRAFTGRMPSR